MGQRQRQRLPLPLNLNADNALVLRLLLTGDVVEISINTGGSRWNYGRRRSNPLATVAGQQRSPLVPPPARTSRRSPPAHWEETGIRWATAKVIVGNLDADCGGPPRADRHGVAAAVCGRSVQGVCRRGRRGLTPLPRAKSGAAAVPTEVVSPDGRSTDTHRDGHSAEGGTSLLAQHNDNSGVDTPWITVLNVSVVAQRTQPRSATMIARPLRLPGTKLRQAKPHPSLVSASDHAHAKPPEVPASRRGVTRRTGRARSSR